MRRIDDATRRMIADMYAHGKLHREIHEETGVAMSTISTICREAGLDKFHKGGFVQKSVPIAPEMPEVKNSDAPVKITARTLALLGTGTGCSYIACTNTQSIDIMLGDWALSIETARLNSFIDELQCIKKIVGVA